MKHRNQGLHDEWTQILANWDQSEKSGASFCRERKIKYWKFNYWKRRLRHSGFTAPGNFVAIEFQGETAHHDGELILEVGNGFRFILKRGFDATILQQALGVLRRSGC